MGGLSDRVTLRNTILVSRIARFRIRWHSCFRVCQGRIASFDKTISHILNNLLKHWLNLASQSLRRMSGVIPVDLSFLMVVLEY